MGGLVAVLRSLAFYAVFYLGTMAYVLIALAARLLGEKPFLSVAEGWSHFHRKCAAWLLGIRVELRGELPTVGALIAMKHESFFEAIDLPHVLHQPVVFAKAELLQIPLWGRVARMYGMVAVERNQGAKALRAMIAAARQYMSTGRVLIIFPEGTRVPHSRRPQLQAGFAGLYKLLGVPVVPVAVNSGPLYHRLWKRAGTVTYVVGEPIPPGLARDEVEARVLAAINALNA